MPVRYTSGGVPYRKVLRDNVQGLTRPAFQRLGYRAGVKSMSGLLYEELRGITKVRMEDILRDAIVIMEHRGAKTVSGNDILMAIALNDKKMGYSLGLSNMKAA